MKCIDFITHFPSIVFGNFSRRVLWKGHKGHSTGDNYLDTMNSNSKLGIFEEMQATGKNQTSILIVTCWMGNLNQGKYEDAAKSLEEMCDQGFIPDSVTLQLLLDLLGTTEQNPTVCKMIQKWAPTTSKQKE
ncbi:hypothetical protein CASFOL_023911 [Castilleja foliolosa]|uniref:Pentatricopeptide repeat-containing protein n=1 Tax=Castilleja foliolosa TaxID=1961234 RepID=A0ABD3CMX5_9LAMI